MKSSLCIALLISLTACPARAVPPPVAAEHYAQPTAWLCVPGRPGDTCTQSVDTTVIAPDNSRKVVPASPTPSEPDLDCFYVYPTVDLSLRAGNHDDFTDLTKIASTTRSQVGRFGELCAMYVPLYRQVTIGTYFRGGDRLDSGLALAYSDVESSFKYYLDHYNHGHRIVLLGHSQGAEMLKRLMVEFFDKDPALRARLVMALPLGGDFEVPQGKPVGGTFASIPICTAAGQAGCFIGYRSYHDGADVPAKDPPVPLDHEAVCVNPGNLAVADDKAPLDAVALRSDKIQGIAGVTTAFVSFPALYQGHCVGTGGQRVLEIGESLGARQSPIDLGGRWFTTKLGTHILDYQIAQDNLLELVRRAARAGSPAPAPAPAGAP